MALRGPETKGHPHGDQSAIPEPHARPARLMSPPVTISVRYAGDDEPSEASDAIYDDLKDELGECSGCGRREALVLTVGLARYCEECAEKIVEDW